MHGEGVQQVHGQGRDGARRRAVGAGQVDAHGAVAVDGLHQHAHGQCEALRVGAVGVAQQGDLVVQHAQGLVAERLLQEPGGQRESESERERERERENGWCTTYTDGYAGCVCASDPCSYTGVWVHRPQIIERCV